MPDCLGSVEKVVGHMCYRFQHFICKRAATGKQILEYTITINQSSCIVGLKKKGTYVVAKKVFFTKKIQIINE